MKFCGFDQWATVNTEAGLFRNYLTWLSSGLAFGPAYARGTGAGCVGVTSNAYLAEIVSPSSAYFLLGIAFKRTLSGDSTDGSEVNRFMAFSNQLSLTFSPSGQLQIRSGGGYSGTVLATTTKTYTIGLYYYITIKIYCHTTSGTIELYDEGETTTPTISLTNINTNPAGTGVIGSWYVYWPMTSRNYPYIDDIYYTGVQAEVTAGPLGNLKVMSVAPTSDGTEMTFTPSSGTEAWPLLDETPLTTTDYVVANEVGQKCSLKFPVNTTGRPILGAQLLAWVKTAEGSSAARIDCKSGGTTTQGASGNLPVNTTGTVVRESFLVNPSGGDDWTEETLSAAEFILERTI